MIASNKGYGNLEYFDLKYIVYPIINTDRDKNFPSYVQPKQGWYENILVKYALDPIGLRKKGVNEEFGLESILSGKKELLRSKIDLLLIQLSQRKKCHLS